MRTARPAAAALLAAAFALPAHAATALRVEVSHALAEDWHSSIQANAGDSIDIRIVLDHTGPAVLGFGSFIFQPTVSYWGAGDTMAPLVNNGVGGQVTTPIGAVHDAPGQYGRIIPYAQYGIPVDNALQPHTNTVGGITYLRIAQAQVTDWIGTPSNTGGSGVNMRQYDNIGRTTTDPAFSTATTNLVIFKFGITLSAANFQPRTMTADVPLAGIYHGSEAFPYVGWYLDMNEIVPSSHDQPDITPASIFVNIPAPASLPALAASVLLTTRRKRRGQFRAGT